MCQYLAENGKANTWHLVHLGGLAHSGAGMLCIEGTAVEPDGRITPSDLGLWDDATEAAFKNQSLSRFRVIHFAVHGLVSTKYPERSALVFRPDPDAHEDGFLQAREIVSLPIRAELVTLSACATGTGKINGEEGVASLVRPFLIAGAKSVVANLWNADDDFTRTLMKEFYTQLASGTDISKIKLKIFI